jgi:hypothetical protein
MTKSEPKACREALNLTRTMVTGTFRALSVIMCINNTTSVQTYTWTRESTSEDNLKNRIP